MRQARKTPPPTSPDVVEPTEVDSMQWKSNSTRLFQRAAVAPTGQLQGDEASAHCKRGYTLPLFSSQQGVAKCSESRAVSTAGRKMDNSPVPVASKSRAWSKVTQVAWRTERKCSKLIKAAWLW